jgi:1-acyl-sn-glycerol-3-phosphate acyltransferase
MKFLRSLLFSILVLLVTVPYGLSPLLLPLSPHLRHRIVSSWTHIVMFLVRVVLGIRFRVIGAENIPKTPGVILCKHQSAWETMGLQLIFPPQVYVMKRELLWIPLIGWGLAAMPMVAINRGAAKDALAQIMQQGIQRLREGFWVVIFPEGTRTHLGEPARFKSGGARLAQQAGVPAVPVAHNAGEFWAKNAFVKQPGEIVVSIGPAIDTTGLSGAKINNLAEAWVEAEMQRLFPHHYAASTQQPNANASA